MENYQLGRQQMEFEDLKSMNIRVFCRGSVKMEGLELKNISLFVMTKEAIQQAVSIHIDPISLYFFILMLISSTLTSHSPCLQPN